jgi:hypothetical protein
MSCSLLYLLESDLSNLSGCDLFQPDHALRSNLSQRPGRISLTNGY